MTKTRKIRTQSRPRRYRTLGCRLTDAEYAEVEVAAEFRGMTPSEWNRHLVVGSNRIDPVSRTVLEQGEWLRYVLGNFLLHLTTDGKVPNLETLKQAAAAGDQHKIDKVDAIVNSLFDRMRERTPPLPTKSGVPNA